MERVWEGGGGGGEACGFVLCVEFVAEEVVMGFSGSWWGIGKGGEGGGTRCVSGGFYNVNSVVVKTWEGIIIA